MQDFTLAHAAGGDWAKLAKSCADQIAARGGRGNLGFLYLTDLLAEDMGSVLTFMRERTGIEHWVGTVGLGICVTGKEYFDQPAVAAMTVSLPEDAFRMLPEMDDESDIVGLAEAGTLDGFTPGLGIVHGDPRNPNTREIVSALAETRSCYLVGGLASSRGEFGLIADRVFDGGLSGVVLSAEVPVVVGLSQGCKLFGPSHTVTACENNIVIELDGEAALEVLLNDIDPPMGEDLEDSLTDIHAAVPVEGSDTGDYLVRNLMGVDPEQGWIAIAENAEPGDQLMFCRRDADSAAQDLRRMLGDLKRRANGSPRGGIYFSCVGRGPNLFGRESEELSIIRAELGDFPLIGFFGNGEISHDRLYGYTGILTLFT